MTASVAPSRSIGAINGSIYLPMGAESKNSSCRYNQAPYDIEWSVCNRDPCPIPGYWLAWSDWSHCSATCELGTRRRYRLCDGPYYGGLPCEGPGQENDFCDSKKLCPGVHTRFFGLYVGPVVDIARKHKDDVISYVI
ncbi:hypothetical protein LSH36_40g09001 [Paralvinella palmiformis]|uniref:Uncharacterized protein n=1 Tax=Paralvinella palmiformis TaxID=53620 RepID=A0AAD9K7V0_9ANNE|nr:hypothetical protein LSH36_40g09001 [Paralvinella palmiformis]